MSMLNLPGGEQAGDHTVVDPKRYIQGSMVCVEPRYCIKESKSWDISGLNAVGEAMSQVISQRQSTKLFGQAR